MSPEPPNKDREHKQLAWAFGVIFELALILECFIQYKDGWFFVEFYNLALISHYPFLLLGAIPFLGDSIIAAIILFIIYEALMVWFWTFLFYRVSKFLRRHFPRGSTTRCQKWMVFGGIVVIAAAAFAWQIIDSYHDQPAPFAASPDVKSLVAGNNAFALDLYQRLKEQPGNLFFSPYSISTGLGMVYAGARGTTERELAATLHFTLPQTNLHPAFGELSGRWGRVQHWNRLELRTANALWYQRDYPITPAFANLVRSNYQGEARPVDFKQASAAAGQDMAAWIERQTGGRLKNAVNPGLLTPDTRLALCDAIYFKGQWASQFRRNQTKPRPFAITTNQTVTVPMMYQKAAFKSASSSYGENSYVELLELPYYGRDLSMVILLPNQADGLPELEHQLNATNLSAWLTQLDAYAPRTTHVSLPRFSITRSLDLKANLKNMGVTTLFGFDADLSGMDGSTNLFISDVLHQAFVEVNERGTEATAMTLELAKTKSIDNRFCADHPFIFLIRDNATGSILFLGRMLDPTKP